MVRGSWDEPEGSACVLLKCDLGCLVDKVEILKAEKMF